MNGSTNEWADGYTCINECINTMRLDGLISGYAFNVCNNIDVDG